MQTRRRPGNRKGRVTRLRKRGGAPIAAGGAPIAAGGFGCVFRPPIRCTSRGPKHPYNETGVSKLMTQKHAKLEMAEVKRVASYAQKIPNASRYFLLDGITTCTPGTLTAEDMKGFNDKCRGLKERGYTEENINSKRGELQLLNIPYGGEDIDKFWSVWKRSKAGSAAKNKAFAETNTALVDLLLHGIRPLNNKGYAHMDLKGQNMLRSTDSGEVEVRVIDWGLSGAIPAKGVARVAQDRVIQYNVPFSNILFATHGWPERLKRDIKAIAPSAKLEDGSSLGRISAMRIVAYQQFYDIADTYGVGHLEYLRGVFHRLFSGPAGMHSSISKLEENALSPVTAAVEYNAAILDKYVDRTGKFDAAKYFREVFSKNVDVWGFLMAYLPLVDTASTPWKAGTLENAISRIICEYCFSSNYATRPIPVDKLARELLSLNAIVGQPTEARSRAVNKKKATPKKATPKKTALKRKKATGSKTRKKVVVVDNLSDTRAKPKRITVVRRGAPFKWDGKRCPSGSKRCRDDTAKCCPTGD